MPKKSPSKSVKKASPKKSPKKAMKKSSPKKAMKKSSPKKSPKKSFEKEKKRKSVCNKWFKDIEVNPETNRRISPKRKSKPFNSLVKKCLPDAMETKMSLRIRLRDELGDRMIDTRRMDKEDMVERLNKPEMTRLSREKLKKIVEVFKRISKK